MKNLLTLLFSNPAQKPFAGVVRLTPVFAPGIRWYVSASSFHPNPTVLLEMIVVLCVSLVLIS